MGKKFADIPTAAEQIELVKKAKSGDRDALNKLVASQNGLARRLALSFIEMHRWAEIDDLVQEALLAVVEAVRWFQPERGFQFNTYASDCMRRRMWRSLRYRFNRPFPQDKQKLRGEPSAVESSLDPRSVEEQDCLADLIEHCMDLADLSGPQRHIIKLCFSERRKLSFDRISELTGWTEEDVRAFFWSGMVKLQRVCRQHADVVAFPNAPKPQQRRAA